MNKEIEMKNEEKETMRQSLLWIGSVVDKYEIDLRDCTGQELVDTLILVANGLLIANDPKKEDFE